MSRLEERWHKVEKFLTSSLENSYLLIQSWYRRALLAKISLDLALQDGLARSFQFLPNQYSLLCEVK